MGHSFHTCSLFHWLMNQTLNQESSSFAPCFMGPQAFPPTPPTSSVEPVLWKKASQVVLGIKDLPASSRDIRDTSSVPGLGRSLGGGHGNPLQRACLENPMDRGAWRATVHRVAQSQTWLKQLSMHAVMRIRTHCMHCPGPQLVTSGASRGWSEALYRDTSGPSQSCVVLLTQKAGTLWSVIQVTPSS